MVAKNGRACPLCEYLTEEMASPCGLKKGWHKESPTKRGHLIICDHSFDEGLENVLNSAIANYESELKELKRKRRLVIKAKTEIDL